METADSPTIRRFRECTKCRQNLYGLPRQGQCPECGQAYKSRRDDAKAKNPRRQLARYRRLLRNSEATLRWVPVWWAVAGLSLTACYFLHARKCWVLAVFVALCAAVRHLTAAFNVSDYKSKIEAIDASASADQ